MMLALLAVLVLLVIFLSNVGVGCFWSGVGV